MLDPKCFRDHLDETAVALKRRGFELDVEKIKALETQRKDLQVKTQELQQERNSTSKQIGQAKAKDEDVSEIMNKVSGLGDQLKALEEELGVVSDQLNSIILATPNILDSDVPDGLREEDAVELKKVGDPTAFDFEAKDHVDLGEAKGWFDFEASAKTSGSRFVVMHADLARLHRALIQFMLDLHTSEHGFSETYVPYLVNSDSLKGTGQLPKFAEDQFKIEGEHDLWMIPTAEVPLTNIFRDEIVTIDKLPIKLAAHTPCFRSEVGSYGKDARGMFRQHQFEKVEMVMVAHPEQSDQLLEELTRCAETVLEKLDLPYRRIVLSTGDTGFSAARTHDLEVWLPGQNCYREVSSCSNFRDFQARRMKARFRNPETGKPELVHTLNGSGLAIGRTLIAVMENYQDKDGNIRVPDVLKPYMNDKEVI